MNPLCPATTPGFGSPSITIKKYDNTGAEIASLATFQTEGFSLQKENGETFEIRDGLGNADQWGVLKGYIDGTVTIVYSSSATALPTAPCDNSGEYCGFELNPDPYNNSEPVRVYVINTVTVNYENGGVFKVELGFRQRDY